MRKYLALLLGTTLAGCGGSTTTILEEVVVETLIDYYAISGLYQTNLNTVSGAVDENLLYIDKQGLLTAYNYLGDNVDRGSNCYRVAAGSDVNVMYSGLKLGFDANTRQFSVKAPSNEFYDITWELDAANAISQLLLGNSISSDLRIQTVDGENKVVISKEKAPVSHDHVLANLCN